MANHKKPLLMASCSTAIFAQNPRKGGTPAMENIIAIIIKANQGLF